MLLRAPESWPEPVVAALAMLLLGTIDLTATYATKEAVLRRSVPWVVAAATLAVALFYLYACALQYADLGLVTLGWVVVLQVGVLLLDRYRYGVVLSADKWVAIGVLLLAQAYLLLAPAGETPSAEQRAQASTSAT